MSDIGRTPDSIRVGACATVSSIASTFDPGRVMAEAQRSLRERLVQTILKEKIEVVPGRDCVHYRLDLYVATPDEFWSIVQKEAHAIAMRFGQTLPISGSSGDASRGPYHKGG